MKKDLKEKAIRLRKEGYSYSYILDHVRVSKSTLNNWLQDIPYRPNTFTIEKIGRARARSGEVKAIQKRRDIEASHQQALNDIGKLTERDIFMLGIGIYIGEGSKTNDVVRVVNSDPLIIAFAVQWFVQVCNVPLKNLVARIHLYPETDIQAARAYWSRIAGLGPSQFQSESVDTRKNKKSSRKGTCPYGTLHLSVRANGNPDLGTALSRRISAWMKLVLEYRTQKRG